jgi:vanillate O-demethylase monooxygenase subunit
MQDVDALNLLQRTLGTERTGYQELSINIDTGGLAARRILARLVEEGDKPGERAAR